MRAETKKMTTHRMTGDRHKAATGSTQNREKQKQEQTGAQMMTETKDKYEQEKRECGALQKHDKRRKKRETGRA